MAGQNGEPDPFGRRSVAGEGVDPFESMREQMDRERENFFRGVNPRDWPNEGAAGSRGGIFNRVSSIQNCLIIVGLPRHPYLY